jgi:Flp pilus assembly pilin Flp
MRLTRMIRRLARDTRGATMVEYAILLSLILVACAVLFRTLGQSVTTSANMANKSFSAK